MTSSFGARRAENIGALFEKVIDRVVGVDAGEENLAVAHNYCMYHTRHHSFPDTDPRDVRDRLDALRERLQAHAQLEKHEALAMLLDRFERLEWRSEVPDVRSRVLLLLLGLSRNPLRTTYSHIDAEAAVGGEDAARLEDDGDAFARSAASITSASDSEPESVQDDAASASTLSDWSDRSDDEDDDDDGVLRRRRPAAAAAFAPASSELERGVAARRAALVASAELAREKEKGEAAGNPRGARAGGFAWASLGSADADAAEARARDAARAEAEDRWEWRDGGGGADARFGGFARSGVGAAVVEAAGGLFPALRGGEEQRFSSASTRRRVGGVPSKENVGSEAAIVGAALDALRGDAAPGAGPAAVPHLSPSALRGALDRARDAAATLDAIDARCLAFGGAGGGWGPTPRACAAAATRLAREIRETLAPLHRRAAGLGDASDPAVGVGAPTLVELRRAVEPVAKRAGTLRALVDAALPKRGSADPEPSAALVASRCLDALAERAAEHQAAGGTDEALGGDGFAAATRLLCAAAQPYLAATHRWLEAGELDADDDAGGEGEFFVRRVRPTGSGSAAAAAEVGSEAWWRGAFAIRRGPEGEPECPAFFARHAEELAEAGKSAALLIAGERRRRGEGRAERASASARSRAKAPPTMEKHLRVAFCEALRAALEAGAEPASKEERAVEGDAEPEPAATTTTELEPGWSRTPPYPGLEPPPVPPGPGSSEDGGGEDGRLAFGAAPRLAAFSPETSEETSESARSSARLAAYAGADVVSWCGASASSVSPAIRAAAALDDWLRRSASPRSPATAPVRAMLRAAAAAPALARARDVRLALCAALRDEWGLGAFLRTLRAFYLGGAGEFATSFASAAFRRLEEDPRGAEGERWRDEAELTAALLEARNAAEASELATLPSVDEIRSVTVLPKPKPRAGVRTTDAELGRDADARPGASRLEALSRVRARCATPWPLALVVPESSHERYGAACAFLLQLRRARAATEATSTSGWSPAARRLETRRVRVGGGGGGSTSRGGSTTSPGGSPGGGGEAQRRLAHELRHFVAAMHEHVVSRVLHGATLELERGIAGAGSLRAMREAHGAFLDAACRQCLVSPDPTWTLLAGQVRAALGAACDLAAIRARAAVDLAAEDHGVLEDRGEGVHAAAKEGYAAAPEEEAAAVATTFRRARSYVLRVVESKLKIGAAPELAELRLRLDFNGFYGTKDEGGGEE